MDGRVASGQFQVPLSHPFVEGEVLLFDPIPLTGLACQSDLGRKVDEEREVGLAVVRGRPVEALDQVEVDAATVALVGEAREAESAGHDYVPLAQGGLDHLRDELSAGGHEEKELRKREQESVRSFQEDPPHGLSEGSSPRLLRSGHGEVGFPEAPGEERHLR